MGHSPCLKALHRSLTPMRGAIVHDPKHPICGGVGLLFHDLIDQPTERLDTVLSLTTTEKLRPVNIPGGQIGQSSFALIFVFDPHEPLLGARQGGLAATSSLNGGLLIGRDHVFLGTEGLTLPPALVEIQHQRGLMREVGVARGDPGAMG